MTLSTPLNVSSYDPLPGENEWGALAAGLISRHVESSAGGPELNPTTRLKQKASTKAHNIVANAKYRCAPMEE